MSPRITPCSFTTRTRSATNFGSEVSTLIMLPLQIEEVLKLRFNTHCR